MSTNLDLRKASFRIVQTLGQQHGIDRANECAAKLAYVLEHLISEGYSLRQMAAYLTKHNYENSRGRVNWSAVSVRNTILRLPSRKENRSAA